MFIALSSPFQKTERSKNSIHAEQGILLNLDFVPIFAPDSLDDLSQAGWDREDELPVTPLL